MFTDYITTFADQNLSKYQYGFWKGFSAQYLLVAMLEKWKGDNKKVFGSFLTDLSKPFDCLLLILVFQHQSLFMIIFLTDNRELRLIVISVHERRFYLEYLKVLCLGLYSLNLFRWIVSCHDRKRIYQLCGW